MAVRRGSAMVYQIYIKTSSFVQGGAPRQEEEKKEGYYITDTFKRRECNKFTHKSAKETNVCKCGNYKADHSAAALEFEHQHTSGWNYTADTVLLPTNAYGEIDFVLNDNDMLPKYLRCDIGTDPKTLGELLLSKWGLHQPDLIISVFGGHSKFDATEMLAEKEIKEGLAKAAQDTKAWVFTSGVNHGVSNLVGDAVAIKRSFENAIPVIGVNSWGAVANNNELIERNGEGLFPAQYYTIPMEELARSQETGNTVCMSLEHEHTHFLLMDHGTKYNFHENTQIRQFRIALQRHLVTVTNAQLVSVMIEGGTGSLEEARFRVKAGLPLVVLGDSGRISDVLCLAIQVAKEKTVYFNERGKLVRYFSTDKDRNVVREALIKAIPKLEESRYDELMEVVEEVISHEDLVSMWKPSQGQLDKVILQSLIKSIDAQADNGCQAERGTTSSRCLLKKQLEQAIQWDRLDIAEEFIFPKLSPKLSQEELNSMLEHAINHRQVNFVENLLDRDARLNSFLTVEAFEKILNDDQVEGTLFYKMMCKQNTPGQFTFEDFRNIVLMISEGVYTVPGKSNKFGDYPYEDQMYGPNGFSLKICGGDGGKDDGTKVIHYRNVEEGSPADLNRKIAKDDFVDPANVLTVYMALIHEQEMAKVFWKQSLTPVFLGLVCFHIHKWMASKEKTTTEITDTLAVQLEAHSAEFEDLSLHVLNKVSKGYKTDHFHELITFQYESWGGRTILEMADYTDAIYVIAQEKIQEFIEEEWFGWLDSDTSYFRIAISIVMPYFALGAFREPRPRDTKKYAINDAERNSASKKQNFIDGADNLEDTTKLKLSTWRKVGCFYKAPITKFVMYMFVYFGFLFAYTMALLLKDKMLSPEPDETIMDRLFANGTPKYKPNNTCLETKLNFRRLFGCKLSLAECIVYLIVVCLIPIEIRQIYFSYPANLIGKLQMYISNVHNKTDLLSLVTILLALVFKMQTDPAAHNHDYLAHENAFRILFAIGFIFFCVRVTQFFSVDAKLGPKVMMMHRMLLDLLFFITFVVLFTFGYGVSTESIMNPDKRENMDGTLLFSIMWRPYINLFGEFDIETIEDTMNENYCKYRHKYEVDTLAAEICDDEDYTCAADPLNGLCMDNMYIVKILLAVYMMLAAVLMLNLLVAVFASTYELILDKSATLWKRQLLDLLLEFKSRSTCPFPFCSIWYLVKFLYWCGVRVLRCCGVCLKEEVLTKARDHELARIALLEIESRRNYLEDLKQEAPDMALQNKVDSLVDVTNSLDGRMSRLQEYIQKVLDIASQRRPSLSEIQGDSLADSESDMDNMEVESLSGESITVDAGATVTELSSLLKENDVTGISARRASRPSCLANLKNVDFQRLLKMGKRSRRPDYPGPQNIRRTPIERKYHSWQTFPMNYEPLEYTGVRDPDKKPGDVKWHSLVEGDERRSYEGRYGVSSSLPQIPCGRTGLSGRGLLDKYGPNHISQPIITRLARDESGEILVLAGKPVLDVMMENKDNGVFALPEIKCGYDTALPEEITSLLTSPDHFTGEVGAEKLIKRVRKVLLGGVLVYKGFLDSEFNTDNSWLETIIVNYHDSNDNTFCDVQFPPESGYSWANIKNNTAVKSISREYLQKVFYTRNAYDSIAFPENSSLTQMYG